jgi:hypothetical protein
MYSARSEISFVEAKKSVKSENNCMRVRSAKWEWD